MKRGFTLGVLIASAWLCRVLPAQESKPDISPHYRLIQVVETSTLQDKINEAAGEGYRLVAATRAPSATTAAIMERVGNSSGGQYRYLVTELRNEQQLNDEGAKGFRLHIIVRSTGVEWSPFGLAVLELAPGEPKPYQYAVLRPGWGSFNEKKASAFVDEGYEMVKTAPLGRMALIFEKNAGGGEQRGAHLEPTSSSQLPEHEMQPLHRYRFLEGRGYSIPQKKELLKAAASGDRLICISRLDKDTVTAVVEQAASPTAPYEYHFPDSAKAGLGEEDLNRAGAQGFRLFRQNSLVLPYVMEKAPRVTEHFQYRWLVSARLSELSEKLEDAGSQGYGIVAMFAQDNKDKRVEAAIVVVVEKSQPVDGKSSSSVPAH